MFLKASEDLSINCLPYSDDNFENTKDKSGKPGYIREKLRLREADEDNIFPLRQRNKIVVQNSNHSLARSGFMYRGTQLFNSLPVSLRMEEKVSSFRTGVKKWIIESIPVKPP